ncbi:MAG: MBL fold metallo-hydrolase [Rhizobiales bacterium]|nr:MBL fold metallo-hydrolase [Hyphomicrobiales bacterium]
MPLTRRGFFAGLAALFAGAGALTWRAASARYYEGPVSDHFDGVRFFDPNGAPPRGIGDLLRWHLAGGRARWPEHVPNTMTDTPPARVEGAKLRITSIGHASFLLQTGGLNILIDPVWSERVSPFTFAGPKRVREPGVAFDALPPIDIVLVSHGHYDHLDIATLSRLAAKHPARVITPLGNDVVMRMHDPAIRAEAYDWHQRVEVGPGVAVTLVPSRHWTARGLFDRNKCLWAGFVIETPAGRVYHIADSGYGDGHHFRTARERYGPFKLAILPIGAYEPRWFMRNQHMNPEESVRAFQDCGAECALGHHFGVFQLTDEAIDAPREALNAACAASALAPDQFRLLEPGEAWEV